MYGGMLKKGAYVDRTNWGSVIIGFPDQIVSGFLSVSLPSSFGEILHKMGTYHEEYC